MKFKKNYIDIINKVRNKKELNFFGELIKKKIILKFKSFVPKLKNNFKKEIVEKGLNYKNQLKKFFENIENNKPKNIEKFTRDADVVIAALGVPNYLTKGMIKQDSIIIDVGINRINNDSEKGYVIVGDACWEEVTQISKAVTPVPGGVGPMTIAMLVENTIEAAENFHKYA